MFLFAGFPNWESTHSLQKHLVKKNIVDQVSIFKYSTDIIVNFLNYLSTSAFRNDNKLKVGVLNKIIVVEFCLAVLNI